MALLDSLFDQLVTLFAPVLRPVRALISVITNFRDETFGLLDKSRHLIESIEHEYHAFADLEIFTNVKTRVVQPTEAFNKLKRLIVDIPQDVLARFKDLVAQVRNKFNVNSNVGEAINELEGIEDLRSIIKKFGAKFARIFERVLGIFLLVTDTIHSINATVDDLQSLVDDVRELREDLNHLDVAFLQQKNKRERIKLEDGSTYYRRIPGTAP